MSRLGLARTVACASFLVGACAAHADTPANINPVIEWNRNLLTLVRTPGAQPATVHATRSFALLHAAIYDAVSSIDGAHRAYRVRIERVTRGASEDAAAAEAAHDVLVALYPAAQTTLDGELMQSLEHVADGAAKTEGIAVGRAVASALLALRVDDGSAASPIPFIFDTVPGHYQSTPPNFPAQPVFTHWSKVQPFVLERAEQFRPLAPPAVTSPEYANAFNEIKAVGIAGGTTATPDQALTGKFWGGAIQNYWNEIAQTAALARHLDTAHSARLFALLNLTFADSVIAFYDAKYAYRVWRPVTAIRAGDLDGNARTVADPNWLPLSGNTPADPSYPGAHAVISAAGATVLDAFFGRAPATYTVTSEVLPGVLRTFHSFDAAEQEASLSRLYAGVHFRTDENAGEILGHSVATFVLQHSLTREPGHDDERDDDERN